ncbi:MAG TPA: M23/M56 family metallopeptidase [Cyclobacteriaceae bacterium]|nr:M23/M56 family metallopeptidase [Cyclobacteriaceae bacterium]
MIQYLISVGFCLLAFLLIYLAVLRHTTFFQLNRYYLLAGIVCSFIIPTITIPTPVALEGFNFPHVMSGAGGSAIAETTETGEDNFSWVVVYFIGTGILLIRLIYMIARHVRYMAGHEMEIRDGIQVISTGQPHAFTFFNTVFLPKQELNPIIFAHEKTHVVQRHWIDLVLIELTCVVLWFNPAVYLYRRSMKLQHEFLADAATVENGVDVEEYLKCLLNQIKEHTLALGSQFHSQPIKHRIMMITKDKTPMKLKSMYVVLMPVLCVILAAFTNRYQGVPSVAPVKMDKARIAAEYGARTNPNTGENQTHTGIDFRIAEGEPVFAAANGTVVESYFDDGRGNFVVIKHDDIFTTSYSHMKNYTVKAGDVVKAGESIGFVGSTGKSTGPHLHYEVIRNGKAVDPKPYVPGL